MSVSLLRVGLIGCGNVGLNDHAPAYLAQPDLFRVVAIADPSPARLELGRELLGLDPGDAHLDPGRLIDRDDVDMVDVCVPQHLRRELVVAAARVGKHVLSEKPLATVPADAEAMVVAATEAGVTLGIVHNYLYFPEIRAARGVIEAGELGAVEVAILNYLGVIDRPGTAAYRPEWRHDAAQAGGGVLMDMLHVVYVAEVLLGAPIERVSAWTGARQLAAAVEDIALCRFETDRNAALVNVGWGVGPGGIAVSGPHGRLTIEYRDGGTSPFAPLERAILVTGAGARELVVGPRLNGVAEIIADFGEAIITGRQPVARGADGLHILEATLAAYESAALGRAVSIPLDRDDPVYRRGVLGLRELDLPAWSSVKRRGLFGVG